MIISYTLLFKNNLDPFSYIRKIREPNIYTSIHATDSDDQDKDKLLFFILKMSFFIYIYAKHYDDHDNKFEPFHDNLLPLFLR